jgi:hypothetical protein
MMMMVVVVMMMMVVVVVMMMMMMMMVVVVMPIGPCHPRSACGPNNMIASQGACAVSRPYAS